jgi:ribonuclease VapC
MIVDTSALLAVLFDEDDADRFRAAFADHPCTMSVASYVEAGLRLVRLRDNSVPLRLLDGLIEAAEIRLAPVTEDQGRLAIEAYRTFGKGSGSPAPLNLGDCFAYALAKSTGEPLLFKGNDFLQTDLAHY